MTRSDVLNARLEAEDMRFLREWAAFKGTSVSDMAREAIKSYRLDMADPTVIRRRRDEHLREAKRLEALLPEAEQKVGEMRDAAADREAARLAQDPVQDALDEIAEDFESASRRRFDLSMNRSWLSSRVEEERVLKGSANKHVRTLIDRLGLVKGGEKGT